MRRQQPFYGIREVFIEIRSFMEYKETPIEYSKDAMEYQEASGGSQEASM